APPGRTHGGGVVGGPGQGRPGGEPARARWPGGGLRAARFGGRGSVPSGRSGGAVRLEGPAAAGPTGLQREEARLPQLPSVLPGGGHRWGGGSAVERGGRRLPVDHQVAAGRRPAPGRGDSRPGVTDPVGRPDQRPVSVTVTLSAVVWPSCPKATIRTVTLRPAYDGSYAWWPRKAPP